MSQPYDEFGLFHENAAEAGLRYDGPPAVRRVRVPVPSGELSGLAWGAADPELVLLHGGAQNAHTWDTVALTLGHPLVALDLPGHGHSGAGSIRDLPVAADDVAAAVRVLAPNAAAVVGMSLGGLLGLVLADRHPDLVRSLVLVDITPGVDAGKASQITDFVNGPASFASFDELLARTKAFNPTRSESSLRRGILHNALQREDGSWVWRYRRFDDAGPAGQAPQLWDVLSRVAVPLTLVRGMRAQSVVDDADEAELLRRQPGARVVQVAEAGHSVQGDQPVELAGILAEVLVG